MLILFLSSWVGGIVAQDLSDIQAFRQLQPIEEESKTWQVAQNNNSEFQWAFSQLFLGYKRFVSSQDVSSCSFTPSCSVYALQAIKQQGVIVGSINFFDRFARCNSLSPEAYQLHTKTRMLYDPVQWQGSLPDPDAITRLP